MAVISASWTESYLMGGFLAARLPDAAGALVAEEVVDLAFAPAAVLVLVLAFAGAGLADEAGGVAVTDGGVAVTDGGVPEGGATGSAGWGLRQETSITASHPSPNSEANAP